MTDSRVSLGPCARAINSSIGETDASRFNPAYDHMLIQPASGAIAANLSGKVTPRCQVP